MGNEILVNAPQPRALFREPEGGDLVGWLQERANTWEDWRNRAYALRWAEYYRLWRGRWHPNDKNRQSERSKIIAPALSQAIEMTLAEMESSVFGRDVWFDLADDVGDEEQTDALMARDELRDDLEQAGVKEEIAEIFLNGALYGTGIGKVTVEVKKQGRAVRDPNTFELKRSDQEIVEVGLESIRPEDFIPDPAGTRIDEMLGCFHKITRPLHSVLEKIETGVYLRSALSSLQPAAPKRQERSEKGDLEPDLHTKDSDTVVVYEYHGKVPAWMMPGAQANDELDALTEALDEEQTKTPENSMVEAIVTFTESGVLLRAMVNPFVMGDRSIVAWQYEPVPGRFWGRGVAEKGYNPQKALDAEMRMRIDALSYVAAPMMGMDASRIDRTMDFSVYPGKIWLTVGDPNSVLNPLQFGNINQNTFNQTQELERMVQSATGAMGGDVQQQLNASRSTATGSSLLMSTFIKRSQRAIQSADRSLLSPLLKKALWRYMQFDAQRYPQDYHFVIKSVAGMAARELEAQALQQTMAMMPEEGFEQVKMAMVRGIVDNTSLPNKGQILQLIDQALAPPSEEEQERQKVLEQAQFQSALAELEQPFWENEKLKAEVLRLRAQAQAEIAGAELEDEKLDNEVARLGIELEELDQFREQNRLQSRKLDIEEKKIAQQARKSNAGS